MITIYGAEWCADCKRIQFLLDQHKIKYDYIDIDTEPIAKSFVKEVNPNGFESIPVVVFEDETILIEPTPSELSKSLQSAGFNF